MDIGTGNTGTNAGLKHSLTHRHMALIALGGMVKVTLAMGILPDTRADFALSLVTLAAILLAYEARRRLRPATVVTASTPGEAGPCTLR